MTTKFDKALEGLIEYRKNFPDDAKAFPAYLNKQVTQSGLNLGTWFVTAPDLEQLKTLSDAQKDGLAERLDELLPYVETSNLAFKFCPPAIPDGQWDPKEYMASRTWSLDWAYCRSVPLPCRKAN